MAVTLIYICFVAIGVVVLFGAPILLGMILQKCIPFVNPKVIGVIVWVMVFQITLYVFVHYFGGVVDNLARVFSPYGKNIGITLFVLLISGVSGQGYFLGRYGANKGRGQKRG